MTIWRMTRALRPAAWMGLAAALAGCVSTTPEYDARFGQALREIRQAQLLYPDAPDNPDQALGLEGNAARDAMQRYRQTFKEPPPVVNVINIGGASTGR